VVVAEDHPLMLEAILRHIAADPDVSVVATASDGPQLVAQYDRHRPDVVLADYWLPGYTGAKATRRIRELNPHARVIFFSGADDPEVIAASAEAGAVAFLTKTVEGPELLAQIHAVARGQPSPGAGSVDLLSDDIPRQSAGRRSLTRREYQVLTLLANGHTNAAIARQLYLSPETVKTHVRRIYDKLGVRDRPSAVRVALTEGLVD
jgi:DNA-binding NarL/FixJ family response regulator